MRTLTALAMTGLLSAWVHPAVAHDDKGHGTAGKRTMSKEEHAFGREGDPAKVSRTVQVGMSDQMRFTPDRFTVKQGDTVKFVVRNGGKVMHEMVIGSLAALKAHADLMRKHPGMEHDEPYMAHVAPGETRSIVWQFTRPGEFHFGCLVPGHFEAGMVGRITVRH